MKTLQKTLKKLTKSAKAINCFLKQTLKNYKSMKSKINKIWLACSVLVTLASCGVTKATISKPAAGTQTTITITTNNPITTDVAPNVELNGKGQKQ